MNQTTTQQNHGMSHFELNLMMNPEIAKKQNNIRSTQISEYSNARHNNTVFVNPKNTSCWTNMIWTNSIQSIYIFLEILVIFLIE